MSNEACKTPVEDLLRAIPRDHVIQFETDDNGFKVWHNCPIGREAHEAADTILALKKRNAELSAELERTYSLALARDSNVHPVFSPAAAPLPASSGPEQTAVQERKCSACGYLRPRLHLHICGGQYGHTRVLARNIPIDRLGDSFDQETAYYYRQFLIAEDAACHTPTPAAIDEEKQQ